MAAETTALARAPQELAFGADFLRRFAVPLCRGGKVHVGAPLGHRGLRRLLVAAAAGLDETEAGQELCAERHQVLSEILLSPEPPRLADDPSAPALLAALHDLLFLLHPAAADLVFADRQRHRLTCFVVDVCERARRALWAGGGDLAVQAAERHSLLHALFALTREDVHLSFWAGRREFLGSEPPARLYAWRTVRRVREERSRASLYRELLANALGLQGLLVLLRASPLTDLYNPQRSGPPLAILAQVPLLRAPALVRALSYHYLQLGPAEAGGPLAAALLGALRQPQARREPADLRTLLCFLSHLHLCALLGSDDEPRPAAPARPEGDERDAQRDFFGLYGALWQALPRLALPPDAPEPVRRRAARHAEACRRAAGEGRHAELVALLNSAQGLPEVPQRALN